MESTSQVSNIPRALIKKLLHYTYRPFVKLYLQKEHRTRFEGMDLVVHPGVFHPGLFYTSAILAGYIARLFPKGKSFLDLGCGSGAVGLSAVRLGAKVTAVDISGTAVECAAANAVRNRLKAEVMRSDLFDALHGRNFDIIAVNPPYYRKPVTSDATYAWNAGSGMEYFENFFAGLRGACHAGTTVVMILSSESEEENISRIADRHNWTMTPVLVRSRLGERFTIFDIKSK